MTFTAVYRDGMTGRTRKAVIIAEDMAEANSFAIAARNIGEALWSLLTEEEA